VKSKTLILLLPFLAIACTKDGGTGSGGNNGNGNNNNGGGNNNGNPVYPKLFYEK
jgi:hypothetical protein